MSAHSLSASIIVPMLPPDNNRYARMHWGDRKREMEFWKRSIWGLIGSSDRRWLEEYCKEKRKMRVQICFYHQKPYDPDNMHAICKIPLDALRKLNYLSGDSPDLLDLHVSQEKLNAKQTRIYITEAA